MTPSTRQEYCQVSIVRISKNNTECIFIQYWKSFHYVTGLNRTDCSNYYCQYIAVTYHRSRNSVQPCVSTAKVLQKSGVQQFLHHFSSPTIKQKQQQASRNEELASFIAIFHKHQNSCLSCLILQQFKVLSSCCQPLMHFCQI